MTMRDLLGLVLLFIAGTTHAQSSVGELGTASDKAQERMDGAARSVQNSEAIQTMTTVTELPQFPGGEGALALRIARKVKYPRADRNAGVEGSVIVEFIVDKEGAVTEVRALKSPSDRLAAEAIRVVRELPRWKPATMEGKTVPVRYVLPIRFQLQETPKEE